MPKHDIVHSPKSKLATELYSNRVVEIADATTQLNYGSIFIFKAFPEHIGSIFANNENYFYAASFITNIISNVAYLFRFIVTPNKNISRISNLVIRALSLALLLLATFGTAALAGPALMAVLGVSMLIYPFVHAVKGFYFLYRNRTCTADDLHKKFFKEKMIRNLLIMAVSTLLVGAMVALFAFASTIAAPVMMAIGIAGAALVVAAQIWKTLPFIKSLFVQEPKAIIKQNDTIALLRSTSKRISMRLNGMSVIESIKSLTLEKTESYKQIIEPVRKFDFFQYSVTHAITDLKKFSEEIVSIQKTLSDPHKIRALAFLKKFVDVMYIVPASATKEKPYKIAGVPFYYKNKAELVEKMEKHVLRESSRAYFAPLKDVGRVHALFRAAFHKFIKDEAPVSVAHKKFKLR